MSAEGNAATMVGVGVTLIAIGVNQSDDGGWGWLGLVAFLIGIVLVNFGVRLSIDCASGDRWWSK